MMFNDEILCQSFSRPGGTYAGADADPAFKRRAIAGLSRWDEKSRTTKLRPACQMAVRKERNMPLLTELEMFWDAISTKIPPRTGLAAGEILSGQNF
jgi:hypothetical protein